MNTEIILIISTIVVGFSIIIIVVKNELAKLSPRNGESTLAEWLKSMQMSIDNTNQTLTQAMRGSTSDMTKALHNNTTALNDRLDTAARIIGDLKKNLGEMSEIGKGIRSLQDILQSPKIRGNIGEQVLSDMIGQTFPKNSFHLQYTFKSGMKVDAVLKTEAGLLCVDSKFPVEKFNLMYKGETEETRNQARKDFKNDVKKHLNDISRKYILPEEGTMDFALMYIPSEAVYYDTVNEEEIMNLARRLRVYPVSPNTLYAHLQVLLLSFQGKVFESKSREVFRLMRAIQKDYSKIEDNLGVLGKHITNAYNSMSAVSGSFQILGQKLERTNLIDEKL